MKALIKFMSEKNNFAYVCAATDAADKQKRIAELKKRFEQSNFSGVANFSADIADLGNPSGVYDSDDFATFNEKARAFSSYQDIKRIVATHNVRDSVRAYALQRNEIIKRNKAKKAEKDKLAKDKFVSHPSY